MFRVYTCTLRDKRTIVNPSKLTNSAVKSPKNVLETARELGAHEFVRLARQLKSLYDLLTGDGGPYTVFVPTDEAFAVISITFPVFHRPSTVYFMAIATTISINATIIQLSDFYHILYSFYNLTLIITWKALNFFADNNFIFILISFFFFDIFMS